MKGFDKCVRVILKPPQNCTHYFQELLGYFAHFPPFLAWPHRMHTFEISPQVPRAVPRKQSVWTWLTFLNMDCTEVWNLRAWQEPEVILQDHLSKTNPFFTITDLIYFNHLWHRSQKYLWMSGTRGWHCVLFNNFSSVLAAPGGSWQEGLSRVKGEDFSRNEQVKIMAPK